MILSYDANGNITTLNRNGAAAAQGTAMDKLTYSYDQTTTKKTNKLIGIADIESNSLYDIDIDDQKINGVPFDASNQTTWNYNYDKIGNLIKDASEGIENIEWTIYGKVKSITKTDGTGITYKYDASGNRISKTLGGIMGGGYTIYYVRDAQGNIMATYRKATGIQHPPLTLVDLQLYGSSRYGVLNYNKTIAEIPEINPPINYVVSFENSTYFSHMLGNKQFELSNHLGNVLATVSDRKIPHTSDNITIDYYTSDITSAQDYYAFGMLMPGRNFSSNSYKFGFNGMEKDNEITNVVGASYDFGARIYDSRVGRWLACDPLFMKFPWQSPFSAFNNNPVLYEDPTGESGEATINKKTKTITVTSIYAFYGSASSPKIAKKYAANIQNAFNSAHAKINIDGVEYSVQFKIVGIDVSKYTEKEINYGISKNKDIRVNIIRLENKTDDFWSEGASSYMDADGANTGYWSIEQLEENKGTTESHENNHGLGGLDHPEDIDYYGGNLDQDPSIDMTVNSNNYVKKEYKYRDENGKLNVDVTKRKVQQKNISAIFTEDIKDQLKTNGKANIGKLTNKYHGK